jgi:hypothetical protein
MAAGAKTVFRDTLKVVFQGPEMVIIPAGEFWMRSVKVLDLEAYNDELPRRRVTIAKPFALGRYRGPVEKPPKMTILIFLGSYCRKKCLLITKYWLNRQLLSQIQA